MTRTPPNRRVVTFYSFKGGVGRTMALANVAYRLANTHGLKVVVVDWDLEAPGLHRFFGLSREQIADARGLLDYFLEWREAKLRNDPSPPDVTGWIVPIPDGEHKPRFGEVSILLAGRPDADYETRLAGFHWAKFYEEDAGAVAVETLREQIVARADVVLIDSRTGFTDAGGICTIQLPDAVVLMTAPNEQSLDGIGQVARALAQSSISARAGRDRPRVWLSVSRVPYVEESELAERWFNKHPKWFNDGVESNYWLREDHPRGLRSFEVPHRARWGFDEQILAVDAREPLGIAYDLFAGTIVRWCRDEFPLVTSFDEPVKLRGDASEEILQAEISAAERRGDALGMADGLRALGTVLFEEGRTDEAIRSVEQALGILVARGAHSSRLGLLNTLVLFLRRSGRNNEAVVTGKRALGLAQELGSPAWEAAFAFLVAGAQKNSGYAAEAIKTMDIGSAAIARVQDPEMVVGLRRVGGSTWAGLGDMVRAIEEWRATMNLAAELGDGKHEAAAIAMLLKFASAMVPDAEALRGRLAELAIVP
jgi:cellulose biosynthesis protein BcsQ